jgi:hypothetical protein
MCTFTRNDGRNHLLSMSWKYQERFYTSASYVNQGKPLPLPVEPRERYSSYTIGINWGKPQPIIMEYHAMGNPHSRYVIKLFKFIYNEN